MYLALKAGVWKVSKLSLPTRVLLCAGVARKKGGPDHLALYYFLPTFPASFRFASFSP